MSKLAKALTAAAGNAGGEALYVEDVFSTYLYTGNGSTQTITNGIDLAGEGGLVWLKNRDAIQSHGLFDTERTNGASYFLSSDLTGAEYLDNGASMTFNSDGFSLGSATYFGGAGSGNAQDYASWTFRKAPKFFDVVTYTGTGSATTISHNLGAIPAVIIVKRTDTTADWQVYHSSNTASPETDYLVLNTTAATADSNTRWNDTAPTDSVFTVGTEATVNASGGTYVAYLFASDAGGFGDDGSESIIKCGSYTGNGSTDGPTVTLGFEPQWLMIRGTGGGDWQILDNMRGIHSGGTNDARLLANSSAAEYNSLEAVQLQATGFKIDGTTGGAFNGSGSNYIYIAIRRPMKTPESGTEVFSPNAVTSTGSNLDVTNSINMASGSLVISHRRDSTSNTQWFDNLRGPNKRLKSNSTDSEDTLTTSLVSWNMDGFTIGTQYGSTESQAFWSFKRATGFFDVVAYRGSNGAVDHSLAVTPELMIIKDRNPGPDPRGYWNVYHKDLGTTHAVFLNSTQTSTLVTDGIGLWKNTSPTDSFFYTGYTNAGYQTGSSGQPYIAYLFATLAGVSKVGSYTGTGADLNVDCGFSAGARFILIKRTDSTGDWYVWDSERGIVAGNDPYLLLNSTAAEVTSTDYIDPLSSGFTVTSSAPAALNTSGGTYIYLAIA